MGTEAGESIEVPTLSSRVSKSFLYAGWTSGETRRVEGEGYLDLESTREKQEHLAKFSVASAYCMGGWGTGRWVSIVYVHKEGLCGGLWFL